MSKPTMTAAFAVMMASAMPMANAQTAATTTNAPMVRAAMTTGHLMPGQIRVSEMNGAAVYDSQNRNSGKIKDVILDRDGRVAAVILNVGGILDLSARYVAVGIDDLKITNDNAKPRFTVNMSKDQLKTAQTYDLNEADPAGSTTPPAQSSR